MVLALNDVDKTDLGCPFSTPFRCSYLDYGDCKALPYTSYPSLYDSACTTQLQTLKNIIAEYLMNECVSAVTPYSCADGSCVAEADSCPTCSMFCQDSRMCVASAADCTAL